MTFQIHSLPKEKFSSLFDLNDDELAAVKATRMTIEEFPGTPCRVSMEDAAVGEEVILVNYCHQEGDSPYQASHAVFVRKDAPQAKIATDQIPKLLRHRLISVRGFDANHMMVEAEAVEGTELEKAIERLFSLKAIDYIHLHYAKPGCFAASVTRS